MSRCPGILLLVLAALAWSAGVANAQQISGVINTYARAIGFDYCLNTVTIASTAGFSAGDSVLIIQMTGVNVDETNTVNFGSVTNENGIANAEFASIESIPGQTTLRFTNKLLNTYNTQTGVVQIVRIPVYSNAVVTGILTTNPWDGSTGGILVLIATSSLTLDTSIDVSGKGFRGGDPSFNAGNANVTDFFTNATNGLAGFKGESIAGVAPVGMECGRGAIATGGGGGDSHNSGGGGGASYGANGGNGGDQTDAAGFGRLANGGIGGYAHNIGSQTLLMMGGGGGGGQQNDGLGSAGAAGGGIIIIITPSLIANSQSLFARGTSAGIARLDGAGGGGAGGAVYLDVSSTAGLTVHPEGGNGGSVDAANTPYGYGPGGGGAGGTLWALGTPSLYASGGSAGSVINCTDRTIDSTSYGASAGEANNNFYKTATLGASHIAYPYPAVFNHSLTICPGDSVSISASGGDMYAWSPVMGMADSTSAQQTVSPNSTTVYTVSMMKGTCPFIDTVHVEVLPKPQAAFTGPLTACLGSIQTYSIVQQANTTYQWITEGGTTGIVTGTSIDVTWRLPGIESVILQASNGMCTSMDTEYVVVEDTTPDIHATQTVLTNPGDQSTLSVSGSYLHYQWSTGDTNSSITVSVAGTYRITVIDTNGCSGTASIEIDSAAMLPEIELALPFIQAAPGDHVILPLTIVASQNLDPSEATDFTYTIRFNKSLLTTVDPNTGSVFGGEYRSVTAYGTRANTLTTGTIAQIEFIAALGDSVGTPIYLDTVIWSNGKPIRTKLDAGYFTLLGVCPAGGDRLFSDSGQVSLSVPRPNPVHDAALLDYSLVEPGETGLYIVDMLGRTVMTLRSGGAIAGNYHLSLDASRLPDGMYNLVLRTPSQVFTSRMEVYH